MQTLEPLSTTYTVPQGPKGRETEFEVQAALFSALRNAGAEIRGEVKWCEDRIKGKRRETCRFDLVLYRDGVPVRILEIKCSAVRHKNGVESTRQGSRYRHFGVPVTFIYGSEDAEQFVHDYMQGAYQ
jgi:hypothetical protein